MRTLQEKYIAAVEGNFSKAQFVRDAYQQLPNLVSKVNSFEDASNILKNRGVIAEAKAQAPKYSTAKPEDGIAPDVLDTAIKFELDKKYGTLDVTPEQYAKCKEMAIKNLSKDVTYYIKQDSIQLDTPGEKMEKVKLNESALGFSDIAKFGREAESKIDHAVRADSNYTFGNDPYADDQLRYQYAKKFGYINEEEISKEDAWKEYQEKRHVTDKTIAAAEKDFNKGWEEGKYRDGDYAANEAIQNIENDEQTKKRIASLTNQLLQDADPRDETVKAYAISVKNDLESGDASRMSQYKDILSLDDLKDDMEHYLTHDVDQLEEATIELSDEEMEKLHKDGKVTLANGSVIHYVGKVDEYEAPSKRGLEEQQLKELFKKIITKVITE